MSLKVAFVTLGCKVNRADTALIRDALPSGVSLVPFTDAADVYVINTCTVTGAADRQSRQLVNRARRRNAAAEIVVTGCMAQLRPEELAALGDRVTVIPNTGKDELASLLAGRAGERALAPDAALPRYVPSELTRPPLKIQDGCGNACTYCAVAPARGAPRSEPTDRVLAHLHSFDQQGCPEVVLSGIDLGAWGHDLTPPSHLAALLARIRQERSVPRLRLSSIEILNLDDRLIEELVAGDGLVAPHLHLPLQSGADAVLTRMNRPYDAATYAARVRAAKQALPDLAIGADVIAGFPGETPEDHDATVTLIDDLELSSLHVFPFSPRPDTPAAAYPDAVTDDERRGRAAELRELGKRLWTRFRQQQVGREVDAVISAKTDGTRLTGFSDQGISLRLAGDAALQGQLVRVRLDALEGAAMIASPIG